MNSAWFLQKINSKIFIGIWHFDPEEIWKNNKQDKPAEILIK